MKEKKFLYMPCRVFSWTAIKVEGQKAEPDANMGKYWVPVFESIDECIEHFPELEVMTLKV